MTQFLYLDIETIPAQTPEVRARIAENVKPPARMSKPETIAAWEKNEKPKAVGEAIDKTALDGAYGHICCIGMAFNDEPVDCAYMTEYSPEGEATVLRDFFTVCEDINRKNPYPLCVVGHNVIGFDIRFILQRAIVLGVKVPVWFPRDPKPWSNEAFDTMLAFAGQRGTISMDNLCRILGIAGKQGVDGSMVGKMWAEEKHQEIAEYCMDDVNKVRLIHKQMQRAFGEAA